jgi:hypothetical protein
MFAPDLIVVLDVVDHPRRHWTVSHEGRGLDFVLEIHVSGDKANDYEGNVERYARLGIPEYFLFDPPRGRLLGYRLPASHAPRAYTPVVPQGGLWQSTALELDLALEDGRLQFYQPDGGPLLDPTEWIDKLHGMVDAAVGRANEEARRAEEEARRAEEEARRARHILELNAKLAAKLRELGIDPEKL